MTWRPDVGEAALIVGCVQNPVNVGKSCTLERQVLPGEVFPIPGSPKERGKLHDAAPCWLVVGESLISSDGATGWTLCRREHLRPLNDPELDVTVPSAEVVA